MKHGYGLTDFLLSIWMLDHECDEKDALITDRDMLIAF